MRQIICTRCACRKDVSDTWRFSNCPDCLAKKRLRRREQKPQELKPISIPFMSYEDYKRHFPQATFKKYVEAKSEFEE